MGKKEDYKNIYKGIIRKTINDYEKMEKELYLLEFMNNLSQRFLIISTGIFTYYLGLTYLLIFAIILIIFSVVEGILIIKERK